MENVGECKYLVCIFQQNEQQHQVQTKELMNFLARGIIF